MLDDVVLKLDPAVVEHDPVHLGPAAGVEVNQFDLRRHVDAWHELLLHATVGQDCCDALWAEDEYQFSVELNNCWKLREDSVI